MKILIVIVFAIVIFNLGTALFQMSSNKGDPSKAVRALAWRVVWSALLIVLLLVSWKLGLIE